MPHFTTKKRMRIYTKTGDKGETGLIGGARISKADLRIEAIGQIDELNANIGVLRSILRQAALRRSAVPAMAGRPQDDKGRDDILEQIQNDLFKIGAELADMRPQMKKTITAKHASFLEQRIDELEAKLPELHKFILPTGTPFSAHAHLARTVCRRAERTLVALHTKVPMNPDILIYINRLSDLLFMLSREDMHTKRARENQRRSS